MLTFMAIAIDNVKLIPTAVVQIIDRNIWPVKEMIQGSIKKVAPDKMKLAVRAW